MSVLPKQFLILNLRTALLTFCLLVGSVFYVTSASAQCPTPLSLWQMDNSLNPIGNLYYDPTVNPGDPDGDGIPNILEWAYNLPPHIAGRPILVSGTGTNGLPLIVSTPGNPTNAFTVEYIRSLDAADSGFSYRVETAASLTGPWLAATNGETATAIPEASRYERVLTHVQTLVPGGTQQFCRVSVTAGLPPCPATIYQIREGLVAPGSPVKLANVLITGMATDGFYLQVKESDPSYIGADYSGVFVHTGTGSPWLTGLAVGFRVSLTATTTVDATLDQVTELTLPATFAEAAPTPETVIAADIAPGGPRSYQLASVIVQLGPPTLTTVSTAAGQFTVTDGSISTLIGESLFTLAPLPVVGQTFSSITGINNLAGGSPRLEPRSAADLPP